jgi:hypothetical protein
MRPFLGGVIHRGTAQSRTNLQLVDYPWNASIKQVSSQSLPTVIKLVLPSLAHGNQNLADSLVFHGAGDGRLYIT